MTARSAALFWPSTCVLCGRRGQADFDLCADCEADLPRNDPACAVCAVPLATASQRSRDVRRLPAAPAARSLRASCRFATPIRSIIWFRRSNIRQRVRMRSRSRRSCSRERVLARARADAAKLLVPVPLAPRRYRQRGYNQATELALAIASVDRRAVRDATSSIRQRETRGAGRLDRKARGVTCAAPSRGRAAAAYARRDSRRRRHDRQHGATSSRRVLRRAGAERVEVWAVARTQCHCAEHDIRARCR